MDAMFEPAPEMRITMFFIGAGLSLSRSGHPEKHDRADNRRSHRPSAGSGQSETANGFGFHPRGTEVPRRGPRLGAREPAERDLAQGAQRLAPHARGHAALGQDPRQEGL